MLTTAKYKKPGNKKLMSDQNAFLLSCAVLAADVGPPAVSSAGGYALRNSVEPPTPQNS